MTKVLVTESYLSDIADSIRSKTGSSATYTPAEMSDAIDGISSSGGITPSGTKTITTNGSHDVTAYATASVSVPASAVDSGSVSISSNGTHDVVGYATASVSVPASAVDSGSVSISSNGNHDVIGYATASVSVPASAVDSGSVTLTTNGTHSVVGYASAVVDVPTSGGGITPTGTISISSNGTYDVTNYASASVSVSSGGGGGSYGTITTPDSSILPISQYSNTRSDTYYNAVFSSLSMSYPLYTLSLNALNITRIAIGSWNWNTSTAEYTPFTVNGGSDEYTMYSKNMDSTDLEFEEVASAKTFTSTYAMEATIYPAVFNNDSSTSVAGIQIGYGGAVKDGIGVYEQWGNKNVFLLTQFCVYNNSQGFFNGGIPVGCTIQVGTYSISVSSYQNNFTPPAGLYDYLVANAGQPVTFTITLDAS